MEQKVSKVDYSKSVIYKLCCKDPNITDIYIGSTTNMKQRKQGHKNRCNNPNSKKYNYKVYQTIREYGGFDNWDMILVEYVNATSKQELEKEERIVIELLQPTLNCVIPTRTNKEYYEEHKKDISEQRQKKYNENKEKILEKCKIYRQNNKEQKSATDKKYREQNKEKLKKQQRIKVKCEFCECLATKSNIKRHQNSISCKKFQIIED